MPSKSKRDIEKSYPVSQFVAKLRRLADSLEQGQPFSIQIAGERIAVPARAIVNIEHERAGDGEEIEFQIKWGPEQGAVKGPTKRAAKGRIKRPAD